MEYLRTMRSLPILFCLALAACLPAPAENQAGLGPNGFPRLLDQSQLAALWAGPSTLNVGAPDPAAAIAARIAALRTRAAALRAYSFDNSALQ